MKRVQRANGSLEQVWGRGRSAASTFRPNGLPAENIAKLMRSRKNALCRAADSVLRSLRSPRSPVPFVLRRDRHKETHKPEVNQQSPITTRHPRTHYRRSRPMAEQERNIPQAVLFGAMRQTAGVIERETFREERMTGVNRAQPLESPSNDYIYFELNPTTRPCENAIIRLLAAHSHAERRASPPHLQKSTSKQTYRKITRRD